jgi:hypothetical protein
MLILAGDLPKMCGAFIRAKLEIRGVQDQIILQSTEY